MCARRAQGIRPYRLRGSLRSPFGPGILALLAQYGGEPAACAAWWGVSEIWAKEYSEYLDSNRYYATAVMCPVSTTSTGMLPKITMPWMSILGSMCRSDPLPRGSPRIACFAFPCLPEVAIRMAQPSEFQRPIPSCCIRRRSRACWTSRVGSGASHRRCMAAIYRRCEGCWPRAAPCAYPF